MIFTPGEIQETIDMIRLYGLDIRTITLGVSLLDCCHPNPGRSCGLVYDKICRTATSLVKTGRDIEAEYGIPIINKRIAVTPAALITACWDKPQPHKLALSMDKAAQQVGADFIGGYSALVHKGFTRADKNLIESVPEALSGTERVCSSINVATTKAGINMDAVRDMGRIIKQTAWATREKGGIGCAKLVVFANMPEDNPFMAGAMHGIGEFESCINVGISGPGVVKTAVARQPEADFDTLADLIKRTAFKITRMGQLVGREASRRLKVPFGIVDLSLAPTPVVGDSVARIIEAMGIESCGAPGTTAALALLNDAVKKGGLMASSHVGGLSGSFIPVSEDEGMVEAVRRGSLSLEKLEALTCVCSVGLDMVAVPGDTPEETLAAILADEAAIGVVNHKTTGVRIIPVPGKKNGDMVEYGGLLGRAIVMDVSRFSSRAFIKRGGRIPAPLHSVRN